MVNQVVLVFLHSGPDITERERIPTSASEPCTHKQTHPQPDCVTGRAAAAPTPTVENKFGKLQVCQRLFPTDVRKLFQTVGDPCPAPPSSTDPPSGLRSVCRVPRNADAISRSTVAAGLPVLLVWPQSRHPPCTEKSF